MEMTTAITELRTLSSYQKYSFIALFLDKTDTIYFWYNFIL